MVYRIKWYLISFILNLPRLSPLQCKFRSPTNQIHLQPWRGHQNVIFFVIIGMRNLTNGFIIAHLVRDKRGDSNAIPSHIAVWGIHRIHIFFFIWYQLACLDLN